MSVNTISPQDLYQRVQRGEVTEIIDVRTPAEFREVHAEVARNVPLDKLDPQSLMAGRNGSPLYVICLSGGRGRKACEKFIHAGFDQVANVEGGTSAWVESGLPVVRGKKTMSLERQVRVAAGALVMVGALLGHFVHPGWIGLAGFVGAGLVFAGLTDTCAMGMLIAKMPWNQCANGGTCSV